MDIWKLIVVFFTSSVKFLPAIVVAKLSNIPYWPTIGVSITGGCFGVVVFFYLYTYLIKFYKRQKHKHIHDHKPKPKKKKIFTKRNRWIVSMVTKYGLVGIAFFTPFILSIPIGMFIAARLNNKFIQNSGKVLTYLCVSVVLWAFFLTTLLDFVPIPEFLK